MRISDWSSDVCSSDLPLRLNGDVFAKLVTGAHPVAGSVVERPHLVVGVGEDNATVGRCGLPLAIPALDQLAACALARLGRMDEAVLLIGADRFAKIGRASWRERVCQ